MKNLLGKTALVTGAASGIGRATALALAAEGVDLALCDIDEHALAEVVPEVSGWVRCFAARRVDVANRAEMEAFAKEVHGEVGAIDILVNNAGVYLTGGFLDLALKDWDWVLSVNLWGVIHGCHYFVPPMVERGVEGHVVNVASMFGYWPSPDVIGYLTAKFGVFGFSEALREDLRRHGIGVSTICPGIVNTGLLQRMRMRHAGADETAARSVLQQVYERRDYKPERVAAAILRAIRRNRARVMVAPESWLMYRVERFCPALSRFVARRAAARMFGAATGKHPLRSEEQREDLKQWR